MFAHFPREMGQNFVLIVQTNSEHSSRKDRGHGSFKFNWLFVRQEYL